MVHEHRRFTRVLGQPGITSLQVCTKRGWWEGDHAVAEITKDPECGDLATGRRAGEQDDFANCHFHLEWP